MDHLPSVQTRLPMDPLAHLDPLLANQNSSYPSEPIFVLPHLRRAFLDSLATLPPQHLETIVAGETYQSREEAVTRLKNYAFSQGFVVVGEGGGPKRARLRCCHQGKGTQNNRKLSEEERKRNTKTQASDCQYKVYAANKKDEDGHYHWTIGITCPSHNHPPRSDPFSHPHTKQRHPTYFKVLSDAQRDRQRHITFQQAMSVVGNDDYHLDRKGYYNLCKPSGPLHRGDRPKRGKGRKGLNKGVGWRQQGVDRSSLNEVSYPQSEAFNVH